MKPPLDPAPVVAAGAANAGGAAVDRIAILTDEPRDDAIDTLARTIYGEARGETTEGREAVANVVINRIRFAQARQGGRYWWGNTFEFVCRKPWQFSCWNDDDPNREKLMLVQAENDVFAECLEVARRAVDGELRDNTEGATHYHVTSMPFPHSWGKPIDPHLTIGRHVFYKGIA